MPISQVRTKALTNSARMVEVSWKHQSPGSSSQWRELDWDPIVTLNWFIPKESIEGGKSTVNI
jgi:hypothetical protein